MKVIPACANYYDNSETCAGCDWTADINVRWCPAVSGDDSFYVYQLVEPEVCDVAYCAGELPFCPEKQFYNIQTEECQDDGKNSSFSS